MDGKLLPDPNKLTIQELKSLLGEVGVQIPQTGQEKKSFYVKLFNENKERIIAFKKKTMGITDDNDGAYGNGDDDNDGNDEDDYFEYTDDKGVTHRMYRNPKPKDEPPKKRRRRADSNPFQNARKAAKAEVIFDGAAAMRPREPETLTPTFQPPVVNPPPQRTPAQNVVPPAFPPPTIPSAIYSSAALPQSVPSPKDVNSPFPPSQGVISPPRQQTYIPDTPQQSTAPLVLPQNVIPSTPPQSIIPAVPQQSESRSNLSFTIPPSAVSTISLSLSQMNKGASSSKTSQSSVTAAPLSSSSTLPPSTTTSTIFQPTENKGKAVDLSELFNFGVHPSERVPQATKTPENKQQQQQASANLGYSQQAYEKSEQEKNDEMSFIPSEDGQNNDLGAQNEDDSDGDHRNSDAPSSPHRKGKSESNYRSKLFFFSNNRTNRRFIIVFMLFVVSLLIFLVSTFSSGGSVVFCDTGNSELNCEKCPENGVCVNGKVWCNKENWLFDQVFCVNKTTAQSYKFAKYARDKLAHENFIKNTCTSYPGYARMNLTELVKSFGERISHGEVNYTVNSLFMKYGVECEHKKYYTKDFINDYFSLCFIKGKSMNILTALLVTLIVIAVVQARVIENTNRKRGYELYRKAIAIIEERRFIPRGELHELVDHPKYGIWSKRQKKQWEIACILLEKNHAIISGPRADGVEGFAYDNGNDD